MTTNNSVNNIAAANLLTGTTLASGVISSSLTRFGASPVLGTPASGTLTNCTGLPVASIVGASSTTFTPGFTGFSSNPTYDARYQLIGKTCFVYLIATADGTSNATGFTITGLPFTKAGNTPIAVGIATDNGIQTSALGVVSGTTLTLYKGFQTGIAASWTNLGVKSFTGNFFYETT